MWHEIISEEWFLLSLLSVSSTHIAVTVLLMFTGRSPSHRKISIILISTLVPVALVLGLITGSFAFWHNSRRKARRGFTTQASNNYDGTDSMQSSKAALANTHLGSKELSGLTSTMGSASFTALSIDGTSNPAAPNPLANALVASKADGIAMPPSWINNIPFSDWEIDADDVAICLRPDGRKWEVGAGAFSKVGCRPQWNAKSNI